MIRFSAQSLYKKLFSLLLLLIFSTSSTSAYTGLETDTLNQTELEEIQKKVGYQIFIPSELPGAWKLIIKTYPESTHDSIKTVRLHYLDEKGKYLIVGIKQMEATKDHQEQLRGKKVKINGVDGYFEAWKPTSKGLPDGGYLRWIRNGTFIKMESSILTADQMKSLAETMK